MTDAERISTLETENKFFLKEIAALKAKVFPVEENPPALDFASIYSRPRKPKLPEEQLDERASALDTIYSHPTSPKPKAKKK